MIGQTVSHFEILEQLGQGGMGVVYKARDLKLDRLVALKFLSPHLRADTAHAQRFIQEARTASALDHPNICTLYEIDETDDGRTFIAMAYYEGETSRRGSRAGRCRSTKPWALRCRLPEGWPRHTRAASSTGTSSPGTS